MPTVSGSPSLTWSSPISPSADRAPGSLYRAAPSSLAGPGCRGLGSGRRRGLVPRQHRVVKLTACRCRHPRRRGLPEPAGSPAQPAPGVPRHGPATPAPQPAHAEPPGTPTPATPPHPRPRTPPNSGRAQPHCRPPAPAPPTPAPTTRTGTDTTDPHGPHCAPPPPTATPSADAPPPTAPPPAHAPTSHHQPHPAEATAPPTPAATPTPARQAPAPPPGPPPPPARQKTTMNPPAPQKKDQKHRSRDSDTRWGVPPHDSGISNRHHPTTTTPAPTSTPHQHKHRYLTPRHRHPPTDTKPAHRSHGVLWRRWEGLGGCVSRPPRTLLSEACWTIRSAEAGAPPEARWGSSVRSEGLRGGRIGRPTGSVRSHPAP